MAEILGGLALVLSVTAIAGVVVVAHAVTTLRTSTAPTAVAPSVGQRIEPAPTRTLAGTSVELPPKDAAVFLFALQGCGPCETFLEALASASVDVRGAVRLIARANVDVVNDWRVRVGLHPDQVIVDTDGMVAMRFAVTAYPTMLVVIDRQITEMAPAAVEPLRRLVQLVAPVAPQAPATVRVGDLQRV
jgi:hypothetical protein